MSVPSVSAGDADSSPISMPRVSAGGVVAAVSGSALPGTGRRHQVNRLVCGGSLLAGVIRSGGATRKRQGRLWLVFSVAGAELAVVVLSHSPCPRKPHLAIFRPPLRPRDRLKAIKAARGLLWRPSSKAPAKLQIHPSVNALAGTRAKARFAAGPPRIRVSQFGGRVHARFEEAQFTGTYILCVRCFGRRPSEARASSSLARGRCQGLPWTLPPKSAA